MIQYVLGLAFGIDNFFSRLLPFSILHPVPLITVIVLLIVLLNFKSIDFTEKYYHKFYAVISIGLLISLGRYYFIYFERGFVILPIFRQLAAMTLGICSLIAFRKTLEKISLDQFISAVLFTSLPFLLYGIYQRLNEHTIWIYLRVQSLFMEPSYFGDYLILLMAPCLVYKFEKIRTYKNSLRYLYSFIFILWILNLYFVQSGTTVLKLISLIGCLVIFYPISLKKKAIGVFLATMAITVIAYVAQGYVYLVIQYALRVYREPMWFFQMHSFYDRLLPIYSSLKSFFSLGGFWGLGFGGDYYEFKNLYPPSTHVEMLSHKLRTLSFYNSFMPKIILYFGIFGITWLYLLFKQGLNTKNHLLKIALLNVLISSLWGIPNFSLPYIWVWLALSDKKSSDL